MIQKRGSCEIPLAKWDVCLCSPGNLTLQNSTYRTYMHMVNRESNPRYTVNRNQVIQMSFVLTVIRWVRGTRALSYIRLGSKLTFLTLGRCLLIEHIKQIYPRKMVFVVICDVTLTWVWIHSSPYCKLSVTAMTCLESWNGVVSFQLDWHICWH